LLSNLRSFWVLGACTSPLDDLIFEFFHQINNRTKLQILKTKMAIDNLYDY
jgi:hypothetical protein